MAKHKRETDPSIGISLPVVPMLDLSFQILFFFIITFNPGKVEGQMAMNLPASGDAAAKKQQDVDPSKISDPILDVPSEFVVSVKYYDAKVSVGIRDSEKVYPVGEINDMANLKTGRPNGRAEEAPHHAHGEAQGKNGRKKKREKKGKSRTTT